MSKESGRYKLEKWESWRHTGNRQSCFLTPFKRERTVDSRGISAERGRGSGGGGRDAAGAASFISASAVPHCGSVESGLVDVFWPRLSRPAANNRRISGRSNKELHVNLTYHSILRVASVEEVCVSMLEVGWVWGGGGGRVFVD